MPNYFEDYLLNSDICQQHANKVAQQARLIKEVIAAKSEIKIISIGCGTSADIKICIEENICSNCEIILVDVDSDAIHFSIKELYQIKKRITPLHGNFYRLMRNLSEQYDLILIGGVFDYLHDKTIGSILKSLRDNLAEHGKVFFTNIYRYNRYRIFGVYRRLVFN